MDRASPAVTQSASEVSDALVPHADELSREIYQLIIREIPGLDSDRLVVSVLQTSVDENVSTVLHVLQHDIDMNYVHAPAAAEEYARRLAQRGVSIAALLRSYRLGAALFLDRCFEELGRRNDDVSLVSATGMRIAEVTNAYIDRVSEEVVSAYEAEKENWLRNLSAARAARVRALVRGERVDVDASETIVGYRFRQHHVGVVCWVAEADPGGGELVRLEQATADVANLARCVGRPIFLPQDETSAWGWLPLGAQDTFDANAALPDPGGIRFAFGAPGAGLAGFRRTHWQALGAQAVAVAAGPAGPLVTSFSEVAPLALMSHSVELVRDWVAETLGALARDDEHTARLRDTLRVFLEENGSFKATAERLTLHKNTVQYRVRKAEEGLGGLVGRNRLQVELALLACHWLGPAILRQPGES